MDTNKKIARSLLALTPQPIKHLIAESLGLTVLTTGLTDLRKRIEGAEWEIARLRERIKIMGEDPRVLLKKSRQVWINANPDEGLTWSRQINGDAFIQKVTSYDVLHPDSTILEIGPGYGRLLRSMLEQKVPFKRYTGADISVKSIEYLKETFRDNRLSFVVGNFENAKLADTFDIAISSLTFKHLYPSFKKMLSSVSKHLLNNSWIFFDLIEGPSRAFFVQDGTTFIRHYEREEINEIMRQANLNIVAYDQVIHDEEHPRLLVVARKTEQEE